MKEIELTEKSNSAHKEFDPVSCGEDVTIDAVRDIKDEKYSVEGNINRKNKNLGRYVFDETNGRVFINVDTSDLKRNTSRDIVETVASLILQLVPEAEEAPEEEAAE